MQWGDSSLAEDQRGLPIGWNTLRLWNSQRHGRVSSFVVLSLTQGGRPCWLLEPAAVVRSRTVFSLASPQTTKPHSPFLGFSLPTALCGAVCQASLSFIQLLYSQGKLSFSESFLLKSPSAQGSQGYWGPSFLWHGWGNTLVCRPLIHLLNQEMVSLSNLICCERECVLVRVCDSVKLFYV